MLCGLLAAGAAGSAPAQDALAGKRLFHDADRLRGTGISCVECHGGLPGGLHGIGKAAGNPAALDYAINAVPQMTPLRGKLSARDLEDLAAYIAQPDVPSADLRISIVAPDESPAAPVAAERLNFPPAASGAHPQPGTVRLSNLGKLNVALLSGPALAGPEAGQFEIVDSNCTAGMALPPGQFCDITVRFRPQGPSGLRSASLGVRHDWLRGGTHVALIGHVVKSGTARTTKPQSAARHGN
jgi:hypothetical protein